MPLITIVNLRPSPLTLQDMTGISRYSVTIAGGATLTDSVISAASLAALEPLLISQATAGSLTWRVSGDPASDTDELPEHVRLALTTPVTALPGQETIVVNLTVAGPSSVVLAAAAKIGQIVTVIDGKGDAATNNVTITVASGTINGAASLVLSTNRQHARLVKIGATTWAATRMAP